MTEATFEPPDHPPAIALASLARGEIPEEQGNTYAQHLARCRRCMAIYAEFAEQSLGEHQATVPASWMDRAIAVPETNSKNAAPRPQRRNMKWAWGAAVLAPALVLTFVLLNRSHSPESVPDPLQFALSAELRADSQGSLVYGDALPPEPRGVRGTGPNASSDASSLDQILEIHRSHPSDPGALYWLVSGYLARNQLRNADAFLREALKTFPDDSRFLNLAAILAYKENRLTDAEAYLRKAAATHRDATVLVNLALVRQQQGDEAEAQTLLSEALSRFPNSPLSPYIRELNAH